MFSYKLIFFFELVELKFQNKPLGLILGPAQNETRCVVEEILDDELIQSTPLRKNWEVIQINKKQCHFKNFEDIEAILEETEAPLTIYFQNNDTTRGRSRFLI